jgi:hypothetical protein
MVFQGEWETSGKKKKTRNQTGAVSSSRGEKSDTARDRSEPGESAADRERSRNRGGGPPRMRGRGSSDSRGCKLIPLKIIYLSSPFNFSRAWQREQRE